MAHKHKWIYSDYLTSKFYEMDETITFVCECGKSKSAKEN